MKNKIDNVHDALVLIQGNLKCPKNQKNTFGNYSYRNCEDILQALKPLLKETDCYIKFDDQIISVMDRVYIKSTATLHHIISNQHISSTALAREPEIKKGMDLSQITGASSSYARKYALNGMFAIDDNKDADFYNNNEPATVTQKADDNTAPSTPSTNSTPITNTSSDERATNSQKVYIDSFFKKMKPEDAKDMLNNMFKKDDVKDLSKKEANRLITELKKSEDEKRDKLILQITEKHEKYKEMLEPLNQISHEVCKKDISDINYLSDALKVNSSIDHLIKESVGIDQEMIDIKL